MPEEVLTPVAACVLFGKSTEAVRRATSEGLVKSPIAFQFGSKPTHLLELNSAIAYWARVPTGADAKAAYLKRLESEIDHMRVCGITFTDSSEIEHYRILHPFPLTFDPAKYPSEVESAD